jgi:hypothetical protein
LSGIQSDVLLDVGALDLLLAGTVTAGIAALREKRRARGTGKRMKLQNTWLFSFY